MYEHVQQNAHALVWPHVQHHFVTGISLLLISLSTALKATMSLLFTLTKDTVTVKLKPTQMRTETIGESDSIFLIGDDGTVATAEDGNFNSFEMESDIGWTVSGNTVSTAINLQQPKLSLSSSSSSKWKPGGSGSIPQSPLPSLKKGKNFTSKSHVPSTGLSWTKSVGICSYDVSSDSIKKNYNLPIILTENTASVSKIADIVSAEGFDEDPVVVIDSENLRIPDSKGTKGM